MTSPLPPNLLDYVLSPRAFWLRAGDGRWWAGLILVARAAIGGRRVRARISRGRGGCGRGRGRVGADVTERSDVIPLLWRRGRQPRVCLGAWCWPRGGRPLPSLAHHCSREEVLPPPLPQYFLQIVYLALGRILFGHSCNFSFLRLFSPQSFCNKLIIVKWASQVL